MLLVDHLGIAGLPSCNLQYHVSEKSDYLVLSGKIMAIAEQYSVVSQMPMSTFLNETFHVLLFKDRERADEYEQNHPDDDVEVVKDYEAYDVGQTFCDYLLMAIPTNPKMPGEVFSYNNANSDSEKNSPFEKLITLQKKD